MLSQPIYREFNFLFDNEVIKKKQKTTHNRKLLTTTEKDPSLVPARKLHNKLTRCKLSQPKK